MVIFGERTTSHAAFPVSVVVEVVGDCAIGPITVTDALEIIRKGTGNKGQQSSFVGPYFMIKQRLKGVRALHGTKEAFRKANN